MATRDLPEPPSDFALDRETLAYIALKAKAFDAVVASYDPTDGSHASDDRFVDALEDEKDITPTSEIGFLHEIGSRFAAADSLHTVLNRVVHFVAGPVSGPYPML